MNIIHCYCEKEYRDLNHSRPKLISMRRISIIRLIFTLIFFHDDKRTVAALLQPKQQLHIGVSSKCLRTKGRTQNVVRRSNKLDFIGSLENSYQMNKTNNASSIFLNGLIEESSPELLRRLMIEAFEDVAPGTWRIVYRQDVSTSFGFGSLLSDVHEVVAKLGNNGEITCENCQCLLQNIMTSLHIKYSTHQISAVICLRQYQV